MSIARMVATDAQQVAMRNAGAAAETETRSSPQPPAQMFGETVEPMRAANSDQGGANKKIAAALDVLSKYIPSEVVAIYIFGLSILGIVRQSFEGVEVWNFLFGLCVLLVLFFVTINWLVLKKAGKATSFPTWPLIAGLVSFVVWAIAIPGNPIVMTDGAKMLAGFAAVVSSYILAVVEKVTA